MHFVNTNNTIIYKMRECGFCFTNIDDTSYDAHIIDCEKQQIELYNNLAKPKEQPKEPLKDAKTEPKEIELTDRQQKALGFVFKKSRIFSKNTYLDVLCKFKDRGLGKDELETVINYIKNVPVVIHVSTTTISHLAREGVYKNIFEITNSGKGQSYNTSRFDWEKNMFNSIYDDAEAIEKVKYGALNLLNNPNGVPSAYSYGNSYLLLKNHVKQRITFVCGDSSQKQMQIATFDNNVILLNILDYKLLDEVIEIALNKKNSSPTNYAYIEAQIHGPLIIGRDIQMLYVNKHYQNDNSIKTILDSFYKNTGCPYTFMK